MSEAELQTECPNCKRLQRRVDELEARLAKPESLLEERTRSGKRQAAPCSKGHRPGRRSRPDAIPGTSMAFTGIAPCRLTSRKCMPRRCRRRAPSAAAARFPHRSSRSSIKRKFRGGRSSGSSTSRSPAAGVAASACRAGIRCRRPTRSARRPVSSAPIVGLRDRALKLQQDDEVLRRQQQKTKADIGRLVEVLKNLGAKALPSVQSELSRLETEDRSLTLACWSFQYQS